MTEHPDDPTNEEIIDHYADLIWAARDLVAILESPHTTVNTKWETGKQYQTTLKDMKLLLAVCPMEPPVRIGRKNQ